MNGRKLSLTMAAMVLGAVAGVPLLRAQTDPAMPTGAPGQPPAGSTSSQTTPGVQHPGMAQDSSANGGVGADIQEMKDKIFLRKAMLGGLAEVQLGELAAQRAGSENVKRFGQRIATDHAALNDAIKPVASSLKLEPPKKLSKEDQAEYDKLNGLAGADFDREYLAYVTADHLKHLKDFHDEQESVHDEALKDVAAQGERLMARHTRMVVRLDAAAGVPVPEMKQ